MTKKMYKVQHKEVRCRSCKKKVFEDDHHCSSCQTGAPGIKSVCPACGSTRYVYHQFGYNYIRGLLCVVACFPLVMFFPFAPLMGLFFGFLNKDNTECICEDCQQGWFPFDESIVSRFNFFVDKENTVTRKFKQMPKNCYGTK